MQVKDKYFFFNSEDPNEAFWLKNPKILPEPCQILLKQKFHIKTSKEKIKFRTIILTSDYLYRTKDDIKYKALRLFLLRLKTLDNSKMIATLNKSIKNPVLFNYSFIFMKSKNEFELFTSDLLLFKKLKRALSPLVVQHTFKEDFLVNRMIGKGSFAKVYLAKKKEDSKNYAVKAFNKDFLTNNAKNGKAALINEILITKQLSHPNIIKIYEIYESDHSIYLILDLVEGGDLLQKLLTNEKYQMQDIKFIMESFLKVLSYMHCNGVIHRDLKPENILLRNHNQNEFDIVLADFGLATFLDRENILFHHCGTPGFIAPEVLKYSKSFPFYNEKCDIYSAGIIFFILLTGKKPFYSKELKVLIELNKNSIIDFGAAHLKYLPLETIDLLKKMLNVDPKLRPSAQECLLHFFFARPEEKIEQKFTFSTAEWTQYLEQQIDLMNSNNNNYSVVYSNKSPLVSRHPAINGQICSIYSSDVSPNMTHAKLEMDTSNNSSKYAINNNSNLPFQIAKLNTHFAQNNMQNLSFDLGRPKKSTKNSSNMLDFEKPINEDIFTGRRISPKKFTELPKIIIPIACEEDYENEETKLD